jgi:hypothetical protein
MQKQTILIVVGTDCLDSDLGPVLERARDISAHLAFWWLAPRRTYR